MFEAITDYDNDDRGQVGIGTLIVFIAMVLVAAIAAGVLINTAGVLQSQASDTGSETQEEVANQIDVVHAVGNVSGSDVVDQINLTIKKSAGSNAIDLTSATVQYTSDNNSVTRWFTTAPMFPWLTITDSSRMELIAIVIHLWPVLNSVSF